VSVDPLTDHIGQLSRDGLELIVHLVIHTLIGQSARLPPTRSRQNVVHETESDQLELTSMISTFLSFALTFFPKLIVALGSVILSSPP